MKKPPPVAEEKLYDFDFLKNLGNHDEAFIQNLVDVFIKTVPLTAKELVASCEQKTGKNAAKIAHKLKASADMFNIKTIKEKIRFVEEYAIHEKNLASVSTQANEIQNVLLAVTVQMQGGSKTI